MHVPTNEEQRGVLLAHKSTSNACAGLHCEREPCVPASERSTLQPRMKVTVDHRSSVGSCVGLVADAFDAAGGLVERRWIVR